MPIRNHSLIAGVRALRFIKLHHILQKGEQRTKCHDNSRTREHKPEGNHFLVAHVRTRTKASDKHLLVARLRGVRIETSPILCTALVHKLLNTKAAVQNSFSSKTLNYSIKQSYRYAYKYLQGNMNKL